jgi:ABC-2 family transporter protein
VIRVTARQFRTEEIIAFGLLAVLAIVLAVTGTHLAHVGEAFQSTCKAAGDCAASNPVFQVDKLLQSALPFIVTIAPALIGLFFGAPLIARELETGTFRLAWTQTITRRRWLAVKLGLVGLASMAIGGLLAWMVDWWASPLDAAHKNRFDLGPFGWHGVAPVGYAAFAFALGATAGVLLRRTVPAMVATLAGFVAARLAVENWIRPNLASPLHKSLSLLSTGRFGNLAVSASTGSSSLTPPPVVIPNDWVLSTAVLDKSGHALSAQRLLHTCPAYGQLRGALPTLAELRSIHDACINKLSAATFSTAVTYQPASRFWPFQWAEMGIFVAAALALCGLTYWWLRREYA